MKRLYINGNWLPGASSYTSRSPSDLADVIDEYAVAGAGELELALGAAHAAAHGWRNSNVQQRADALDAIGSELLARKAELGQLLAREEGKTLPEAIGEVGRAGAIFKFYGQEAL